MPRAWSMTTRPDSNGARIRTYPYNPFELSSLQLVEDFVSLRGNLSPARPSVIGRSIMIVLPAEDRCSRPRYKSPSYYHDMQVIQSVQPEYMIYFLFVEKKHPVVFHMVVSAKYHNCYVFV